MTLDLQPRLCPRALGAAMLLALLAGCAAAPSASAPPPQACPAGPPPVGDAPLPLPSVSAQRQVLRPAHWEWNGHDYIFVAAAWVDLGAGVSRNWEPGHWALDQAGCRWVAGEFK